MAIQLVEVVGAERKLTRRGRLRKRELMQGAMLLFSEMGYEATTTKAIAESVGVTEAVIFRYFPSKRQLFREVVDEYKGALHYPVPFEDFRERPFPEALLALLKGYLDNSWANRRCMRLFLLATFHDADVLHQLSALFEYRKARLEAMMAERVRSGELRAGVDAYAAEVICLSVTGFLVRALRKEPASFGRARDRFLSDLLQTVTPGLMAS